MKFYNMIIKIIAVIILLFIWNEYINDCNSISELLKASNYLLLMIFIVNLLKL